VFNDLFEEVVTENILLILICCDKKNYTCYQNQNNIYS